MLPVARVIRRRQYFPVLEGEVQGRIVPPSSRTSSVMEIAREEFFGPLVGVIKADDETHALGLANASDFGYPARIHPEP
ncbi:aldehyde dehydrogenase family protein [Arthrobacter globiformis]|uniref:aldehyde dehydrogenase family protein n=1 Tax=Arthrobacter globiformis TaxID=1665 RepID=UPI0027D7B936|nr:aldehyde dehydrogenase family protein [Arthrobacter globiformis]